MYEHIFSRIRYGAPFWKKLVENMDPDQLAAYQAYVAAYLKESIGRKGTDQVCSGVRCLCHVSARNRRKCYSFNFIS